MTKHNLISEISTNGYTVGLKTNKRQFIILYFTTTKLNKSCHLLISLRTYSMYITRWISCIRTFLKCSHTTKAKCMLVMKRGCLKNNTCILIFNLRQEQYNILGNMLIYFRFNDSISVNRRAGVRLKLAQLSMKGNQSASMALCNVQKGATSPQTEMIKYICFLSGIPIKRTTLFFKYITVESVLFSSVVLICINTDICRKYLLLRTKKEI